VQGKKQILHASFYLRNKNTPHPSKGNPDVLHLL